MPKGKTSSTIRKNVFNVLYKRYNNKNEFIYGKEFWNIIHNIRY